MTRTPIVVGAAFRRPATSLLITAAAVLAGVVLAVGSRALAQQQDFDKVQMDLVQVRPNVYMIAGAGGNTTIQFGDEGVLVVDTQFP